NRQNTLKYLQPAEAERLGEEALALVDRVYPPETREVWRAVYSTFQAYTLLKGGKLQEAKDVAERAVRTLNGKPDYNWARGTALAVMGKAAFAAGDLAGAETSLREGVAANNRYAIDLAEVLVARHKYEEAEAILVPRYRELLNKMPHQVPKVQRVRGIVIALYEAWGKPD